MLTTMSTQHKATYEVRFWGSSAGHIIKNDTESNYLGGEGSQPNKKLGVKLWEWILLILATEKIVRPFIGEDTARALCRDALSSVINCYSDEYESALATALGNIYEFDKALIDIPSFPEWPNNFSQKKVRQGKKLAGKILDSIQLNPDRSRILVSDFEQLFIQMLANTNPRDRIIESRKFYRDYSNNPYRLIPLGEAGETSGAREEGRNLHLKIMNTDLYLNLMNLLASQLIQVIQYCEKFDSNNIEKYIKLYISHIFSFSMRQETVKIANGLARALVESLKDYGISEASRDLLVKLTNVYTQRGSEYAEQFNTLERWWVAAKLKNLSDDVIEAIDGYLKVVKPINEALSTAQILRLDPEIVQQIDENREVNKTSLDGEKTTTLLIERINESNYARSPKGFYRTTKTIRTDYHLVTSPDGLKETSVTTTPVQSGSEIAELVRSSIVGSSIPDQPKIIYEHVSSTKRKRITQFDSHIEPGNYIWWVSEGISHKMDITSEEMQMKGLRPIGSTIHVINSKEAVRIKRIRFEMRFPNWFPLEPLPEHLESVRAKGFSDEQAFGVVLHFKKDAAGDSLRTIEAYTDEIRTQRRVRLYRTDGKTILILDLDVDPDKPGRYGLIWQVPSQAVFERFL